MSKSAKKMAYCRDLPRDGRSDFFAVVMTVYHWDFSRLSTVQYETNSYEIKEEFSSIKLNTETADILFAVSDDGVCRVICDEQENKRIFFAIHIRL